MPVYEYLCRTCDNRFEARRPMQDAASPIVCPDGHDDAVRMLSVFASVGRSAGPGQSPAPAGGGCGPGCACAHAG